MTDSERTGGLEGPRLGLDRLLEQLIVHAEEMRGTQQRLHKLLQANRAVVEELDLRTVLHRVIEAAVDLVRARYGAIAVLDNEGQVAEFIYVGMDEETVAGIGRVPEACGLLGALSNETRPMRLQSIADDPRSVGFPPGHPPMTSFLGVPIRVRGETYGNLYLTEQREGQFTADDEELVDALAATAGVAIANARLFEHSRHRERWTAASVRVTHELLSREGPDPLALIAER
ncbi:MAG TPA: GAF domain-containing protein, partial [Nocardioidaceae bacterium]|nr:GAF domain-containing protein [Nocardioidaceae bacterium]